MVISSMTTPEAAMAYAIEHLALAEAANPEGAMMAAAAWMQDRESGYPQVAMSLETARSDAAFWADTASPIELECYMLAASNRLRDLSDLFHGRQIKRLVAALWQRMSPDEKKAFLEWCKRENDAGR